MGYGQRPVGNAGSGKHTGRTTWIGGRHRKRGGCGLVVAAVGTGLLLLACLAMKGIS